MKRLLDQHANEVKMLGRVVDCWYFKLKPPKIEHPTPYVLTWGTTTDGNRELFDQKTNEGFQRQLAEYDDAMDHKELKEKTAGRKAVHRRVSLCPGNGGSVKGSLLAIPSSEK